MNFSFFSAPPLVIRSDALNFLSSSPPTKLMMENSSFWFSSPTAMENSSFTFLSSPITIMENSSSLKTCGRQMFLFVSFSAFAVKDRDSADALFSFFLFNSFTTTTLDNSK
jgi:hypothetical protein